MANIQVKIQLQDTVEDVISGVAADKSINNVSALLSKNTSKNDGMALLSFALGYLKFDDNGNFVNSDGTAGRPILERSYKGFVFGVTNNAGEYEVTVTVSGTAIDSLIFYGDKSAEQYAIEAYLDGDSSNTIYSDDNEWAVKFSSPATSHSITFTKWKRANYNACITHIAVLVNDLWLDNAWIKTIESVSQSTGRPNEISYGTIANSGSVSFVDRNGELLEYVSDGIIDNSNLPISIYANGRQVQSHIVNDSDYDKNSILLSFEMTNRISDWASIPYEGYNFNNVSLSAYMLLVDILQAAGISNIDAKLGKKIIVGNGRQSNRQEKTVKEYLSSISIPYPYIASGKIKNAVDEICKLAQLNIYNDDFGELKIVSGRPIATEEELKNIIVVPARCQKSQLSETTIGKTKYDSVEITEYEVAATHNATIVSSNKLICHDGTNYIGNNAGVNEEQYDAIGGIFDTTHWFQFNYSFNINDIDAIITRDAENIKINTNQNRKNYQVPSEGNDYVANAVPDTSNVQELTAVEDPLPYHSYALKAEEDIFSVSETNGIVSIRGQVESATNLGGAVPTGVTLNAWFLQNFTFDVLKTTYSFNENTIKADGKNKAYYEAGNILQTGTKYNSLKMSEVIKNNIIDDYSNGISDATISVVCSDYYNANGVKVKSWASGDILEVGDIVRIDKDNMGNSASAYRNGKPRVWRVTGRTFRKEGVPLIDLELQEVKQ